MIRDALREGLRVKQSKKLFWCSFTWAGMKYLDGWGWIREGVYIKRGRQMPEKTSEVPGKEEEMFFISLHPTNLCTFYPCST